MFVQNKNPVTRLLYFSNQYQYLACFKHQHKFVPETSLRQVSAPSLSVVMLSGERSCICCDWRRRVGDWNAFDGGRGILQGFRAFRLSGRHFWGRLVRWVILRWWQWWLTLCELEVHGSPFSIFEDVPWCPSPKWVVFHGAIPPKVEGPKMARFVRRFRPEWPVLELFSFGTCWGRLEWDHAGGGWPWWPWWPCLKNMALFDSIEAGYPIEIKTWQGWYSRTSALP